MKTSGSTVHLLRQIGGSRRFFAGAVPACAVHIRIGMSVMLVAGCAAVDPAVTPQSPAPDAAQIAGPSAAQAHTQGPALSPQARAESPAVASASEQKVPAKGAATSALQTPPATAQSPARPASPGSAPEGVVSAGVTSTTPTIATRATGGPSASAAASRVANPPQAAAPLDIKSLEARLRDTRAIGVFTKLTLKNQVDDLLDQFRARHQGRVNVPLADLRRSYDLLVMKVLALLQDGDKPLASAIASSRESMWSILSDPARFAAL